MTVMTAPAVEAKPFVKWVGGKRQLLADIAERFPKLGPSSTYHEPFVGAGAVYFRLQPKRAVLTDYNERLIRTYRGIKTDVEGVIKRLRSYPHKKSFYLEMRARDIDAEDDAEVLVLVGSGRVPPKIARRIPIGLALTYASGALSPADQAQADRLALQGLVSWVNFPELAPSRVSYDAPRFSLDGKALALDRPVAIDEEARKAWKDAQGAVVAAAITRMIARIAAGETVRRTTKDGVVGALLSLGVQATLTATDTPDTRSWQTLPARLTFGRIRVKPGVHDVEVVVRGARKRQRVTVAAGGFAVVAHTVLR